MVVIIFCINRCIDCRYLPALGVAYAYPSFSVYCFCQRHGHYVIRSLSTSLNTKTPARLIRAGSFFVQAFSWET